jgi:DNA mismatch repair protein MutL
MPIKILPPDISNKIAAGEVVERPASVVKELVENAIDAESTNINIEIRAGGKRLISVSDNGAGMSREDALIAIERHATSKISTVDDLETIQTFGFRGEALPSIASVSQFELLTRTPDAVEGTKITVEGGVVRPVQASGCSPGTHITVNNLFYNVPARLKFLKTDATELNHITNQVMWAALANPQTQFALSHNNRSLVDVRACESYIERIRLLYGKEFAENLIEFEADLPNLHLHCFIGKPDFTKANRNYQLFFLNRRPIRSKVLGAALNEAMRSMVPKDRYVVAFLFLTMNGQHVDVNVHPAKIEVRFQNERSLYSGVVRLLHSGIYKNKYIPKMETEDGKTEPTQDSTPEGKDIPTTFPPQRPRIEVGTPATRTSIFPRERSESVQPPPTADPTTTPLQPDEPQPQGESLQVESVQLPQHPIPEGTELQLLDFEGVQLKTNLFNTYIVAEAGDRVFLIDQHVAAERVLYERFVEQLKTDGIPVQGLLLPITIEATPQQLTALDDHSELFEKLGFDVERFGGKTILVRSIPATLPTGLVNVTVTDLLDGIGNATTPTIEHLEVQDKALITLACKSAVKAGDVLSMDEMVNLIKDLSQAKLPFNCPHARPIIVEIHRNELESRFKRR